MTYNLHLLYSVYSVKVKNEEEAKEEEVEEVEVTRAEFPTVAQT